MLKKLTLAKPWLDHPAGAEVEVDAERLAWMRENGYDAAHLVAKEDEQQLTDADQGEAGPRPPRKRRAVVHSAEESEE